MNVCKLIFDQRKSSKKTSKISVVYGQSIDGLTQNQTCSFLSAGGKTTIIAKPSHKLVEFVHSHPVDVTQLVITNTIVTLGLPYSPPHLSPHVTGSRDGRDAPILEISGNSTVWVEPQYSLQDLSNVLGYLHLIPR